MFYLKKKNGNWLILIDVNCNKRKKDENILFQVLSFIKGPQCNKMQTELINKELTFFNI